MSAGEARTGLSIGQSRAPDEEVSDQTLMQQRVAVQEYVQEVLIEVLLFCEKCLIGGVEGMYIVANLLNSWMHSTSCDDVVANAGAGVVRAIGHALGKDGLRSIAGSVNENVMKLFSE